MASSSWPTSRWTTSPNRSAAAGPKWDRERRAAVCAAPSSEHARSDNLCGREPGVIDGERRRVAQHLDRRRPPGTRKLASAGTQGDRRRRPQPGEVRVRVASEVVDRRQLAQRRHRPTPASASRPGRGRVREQTRRAAVADDLDLQPPPLLARHARRSELGGHVAKRQRDVGVVGEGAGRHPADDISVMPDRLVAEYVQPVRRDQGQISR